jgi:hypothetical protein
MTPPAATQRPGDKMKKAICAFSELLKEHPEIQRATLLHQVEIKFDLSPKECEFLDTHLAENECQK